MVDPIWARRASCLPCHFLETINASDRHPPSADYLYIPFHSGQDIHLPFFIRGRLNTRTFVTCPQSLHRWRGVAVYHPSSSLTASPLARLFHSSPSSLVLGSSLQTRPHHVISFLDHRADQISKQRGRQDMTGRPTKCDTIDTDPPLGVGIPSCPSR